MTVARAMSLGDFRSYLKKLRRQLSGADGAVLRGIHSGVMRAVVVVQRSVDNAPPASPGGVRGAVDTGDYKRRWRFVLTPTGGRVSNNHGAADVIERGRRRGRRAPPVAAIKAWAKRRLGLSDSEADKAKYPIANAISKRGLTGRRVLTNKATVDEITRVVLEEVRDEVRAAFRRARGGA